MGFVALEHLKWGDGVIEPGDEVPEDEPGRDYGAMVRLGMIAETHGLGDLSDDAVRSELAEARAELKKLRAAADAPAEGPRLVLTDEQRELLVDKGLEGEFTLEELDAALTPEEDVDATEEAKDAEPAPETDEPAPADTAPDEEAETEPAAGDDLPEGVVDLGGGWFQLADGETKVQGRKALSEARAK